MRFFRIAVILPFFLSLAVCFCQKKASVKRVSLQMCLVNETRSSGKEFLMNNSKETLFLEDEILVSEKDIGDAALEKDSFGRPSVLLQLKSDASERFAEITGSNNRRRLAIVADGVILTAPVIQERISGGKILITGTFSLQEAEKLARSLSGN
jgi:preprotein translocase subunit SecD